MKKMGARLYSNRKLWIYVIPIALLVSAVLYIPFLMSLYYSLTEWNGISKKAVFIGLDNFKQIFIDDPYFRQSAIFTLKYSIVFIIVVNVLAVLFAVLLDQKIRATNFIRAALFTPYIISMVIIGFIWRFIFMQGFDTLYNLTGWEIFSWSWLGEPNLALISLLIVSIWQSIGFYIVIYIAGLQSIPQDALEAATVDGAGTISQFFGITLPLLMPSITTCVFLSLTNSIKVFDIIVSLTNGGPGGATSSLTFDIYKEAFVNNSYGYGTAKSLILFVCVLVITLAQVKFFKGREVEM
ncbi:sugar ABC transporter permease [Oscillospiraceae bacterium PP1C4]